LAHLIEIPHDYSEVFGAGDIPVPKIPGTRANQPLWLYEPDDENGLNAFTILNTGTIPSLFS
jgi:hypothetical protein